MTGPGTGTPDWQTFSTLHGGVLYDNNITVPAGANTTLGQWDSSSYNAVHLSILPVTNGGTLTVLSGETVSNIPDDIAGQWVIRPETRLEVTVPLPRKRLTISVTAEATLNWNFSAHIALTNVAGDRHHYYGIGNVVGANAVAIGVGAVQTYFPTTLLPGPAHLWLFNNAPANRLLASVSLQNPDGTGGIIVAQMESLATETNLDLIIPTRLYKVDIQNTGPGADNYYFCLSTTGMQT